MSQPATDLDIVVVAISDQLPTIARQLIAQSLDLTTDRNQRFYDFPDDPIEHKPSWHQWGIISHSRLFEQQYLHQLPTLLQVWDINEVTTLLDQTIDGYSKHQLLRVVGLLHDVGKFTTRTISKDRTYFIGHEQASGKLIAGSPLRNILENFEFTPSQIDYIATCATLHFELGKVRNHAKADHIYTTNFAQSLAARRIFHMITDQHISYYLEIGLLFLADSLSKVGLDEQSVLLHPELEEARLQVPVNIAVAKWYIKSCFH